MPCKSIKEVLHWPVLDLVESQTAEFFSNAAAISATQLQHKDDFSPIWIQRRNVPDFRNAVIRETGKYEFLSLTPYSVSAANASDNWKVLAEHVGKFQKLNLQQAIKTVRALFSIGYYELASELITSSPLANDPAIILLYCSSQISQYKVGHLETLDSNGIYSALQHAADTSPAQSPQKISALIAMFLLSLRDLDDKNAVKLHYQQLVEAERMLHGRPDFLSTMLRSRILRASAMYPHLLRQFSQMTDEMDMAEELALSMPANTTIEIFLKKENLFSVYESRIKEFLARNELDRAHQYAQKLVNEFPFNSTARLEAGEVLLRKDQHQAALLEYASAAAYAPPGSAIAWFMAGQCHEAVDDYSVASTCYTFSHRHDDLAISPIERICQNPEKELAVITQWSNKVCAKLQSSQVD